MPPLPCFVDLCSSQAILITYWQCASLVVYFTVLGGSTAQASTALYAIYTSALSGSLRTILSIISVSMVPQSSPASNYSYVTSTVAYPYRYPYRLPVLVPYSYAACVPVQNLLPVFQKQ